MTRGLPGAFDPPTTFTPRAGVSTLARLADGTLVAGFQWFPADDAAAFDRIALRTSADEGATWSAPRRVDFVGLPEAMTRQFDPTLVPLPDGRLRLYFTGNQGAPTLDATIGIYSAVSSDLATFTFEPGERFGLDDDPVIDCAVARLGDTYHLLAPRPGPPGAALHATSADGLAFARQPDIVGANWQNWTGNLMATSTGLHFFGTPAAGAPPGGVWTSSTTDGVVWSAPTSLGVAGGDPAALLLGDGRLLVTTTLPPTPAPVVSSTGIMLYGR